MAQMRLISPVFVVFALIAIVGCSRQNPSGAEAEAAPRKSAPASDVQEMFARAESLKSEHNLLQAKGIYQQILEEHPDFDKIDVVQQDLGDLNLDLLYSKTMIEGKTVMHEIKPGDTLGKIAKQYGTTVGFIKRSNGLTKDIIRVGDKVRVWTAPFSIFVDKSENTLTLKTGDEILKIFIVSTGKDNSTPVGEFTITTKLENPTWYKSGAVVAPNSPENGLGTRWMGFDLKGYGIHGTIEPENMGKQVTAGCVRMLNQEVEQLYDLIPTGTKVTITD